MTTTRHHATNWIKAIPWRLRDWRSSSSRNLHGHPSSSITRACCLWAYIMYPTNNVLPTVVPVQPPPPPAMSHLKSELAPPVTSLLVTESVLPTASNGTIDLGIIGGKNSQLNYNSLDIAKMLSEEKISPFFVAGRRKRAELSSVDAAARKRTRVCVCVLYIWSRNSSPSSKSFSL